ncbi:alpha-methylacyl-CoA racemase [Mesobacillus campisalis]|uniref:Alpha-methylacyl-CoA racemase n=1 Tax=Mesobacillus campisalis TaxID=1408103 RepID=A0A0M2SV82_9BACI|nr:CoA transferase [Mesobacillus campisalis]KKK36540.1 alpha-methylacyl-CoA racemase [Mesobacillus campisalis]
MLEGIRIIDFTNYLPGPYATLRLAEMGAEIIKVEPPSGDPARNTGRTGEGKDGPVFRAHNRGKKSIVLDLKSESGRDTALRLIAGADAIIESFRPGVMDKLGLGYSEAAGIKPDIVYVSITGYGKEGEMAQLGSHDLNYMALSGVLAQLKDENGRPVHPANTFADYIGGMAASERLLAGLVSRWKTGKGSYHCLSLTDAMLSLMANHVLIENETGYPHGVSVLGGKIVAYNLYETKDGRYISLGALEPKFWNAFCLGAGREDWLPAHFTEAAWDNKVYREMLSLFKSRTLAEWIQFGQEVDCCMAPVLEAGELAGFPYFRNRGSISDREADGRQVKMHGDLPGSLQSIVPQKGEHANEILRELESLHSNRS